MGAESANCSSFNPRSYKRSDDRPMSCVNLTKLSIHAPTRGATLLHNGNWRWGRFQSTLLQEERQDIFHLINKMDIFQSTLLQEERLYNFLHIFFILLFQSTLLQEERQLPNWCSVFCKNFQSTLLQEERQG